MTSNTLKSWAAAALSAASLSLCSVAMAAAPAANAGIAELQHEWEVIQYTVPKSGREERFSALATQAHQLTQAHPDQAEPHVWEGIILSSWANAKGGMGALGIAKQAKAEFETAISIDARALGGSAVSSLGVLYYKVPGWPIGFGDNTRAEALLKQALTINPASIDTNYFYADYLAEANRKMEALPYLQRALQAPPRPGREMADKGRREEINTLMAKIKP